MSAENRAPNKCGALGMYKINKQLRVFDKMKTKTIVAANVSIIFSFRDVLELW